MALALTQSDDTSLLHLDREIDISSAAELKTALLEAISSGKTIRVSMDEVEELDVTAFQLLWAASRKAQQAEIGFAITGETRGAVQESLSAIGLDAGAISA